MAIADIFVLIAPEFADVDPGTIDTFIELATNQVSQPIFSADYELAVAYLAAHMMALSARNSDPGDNGVVGSITMKKEGDLAIGYGSSSASNTSGWDGPLMTTSYGIEFLRLRGMHVIGPRTFYDCC